MIKMGMGMMGRISSSQVRASSNVPTEPSILAHRLSAPVAKAAMPTSILLDC
jgi:hypothetical protein